MDCTFGNIKFTCIPPIRVPLFWDQVLPGVRSIHAGLPVPDWTPLELYKQLLGGSAWLWIGSGQGEHYGNYAGFMVFKPFHRGDRLLIWLAWGEPWLHKAGIDCVKEGMELAEMLARIVGFKKIEMQTTRRGWERRLKNFNFQPYKIVYFKEVE